MTWNNKERGLDVPTDCFGIANYAKVAFWTGHCHYELELMEVSGWLCAILKNTYCNEESEEERPRRRWKYKSQILAIESSPFT